MIRASTFFTTKLILNKYHYIKISFDDKMDQENWITNGSDVKITSFNGEEQSR